ncbi:tRNA N6-adenosine(37)-N6-threonylcarbamoyltransferase complex dimerization subunit TsaB [Orenia metallireducens]|jgi:tRNA threonylcarbamoyladenosine biosynthesis protein TsaB|uniref:tRNA N6-adenosine(37)-N6-threonylcarbamoyltransferase complex dimerization subunit TsaB n=1 Tax=Orenia metallireducens TaxID=1413210 RepID=A0A1C0ABK9_9FIRM|nr:tRNA (adenosine(37)-N6)-threonylcarbamoyltransferase complex dimerization subunit type 1 TsaB [Orenia metallireducens]OCL27763.1 tRNA N6-adenosine(37)-N6-threonylcarbamoyltransferase complex dimerization subunit TsaB [Orenia metallireducens]
MLTLAIDSSTNTGSIALISEDGLIGEELLNLTDTHSQRLMPQLVNLLEGSGYEPKDLEGVGVGLGPGSFTGIRIGLTTAKTLAQSLKIPIIGISTLEAMAYNLKYTSAYLCPMIDGRRDRVFTVLYKGKGYLEAESQESLIAIDDLLKELVDIEEDIYFIGEVANKYRDKIMEEVKEPRFVSSSFNLPKASIIGELSLKRLLAGKEDNLFTLTPNYLKRSQAEIQWEKKYNK